MSFFKDRRKKGFTLTELIIVIAVIGIILAIAIPNFVGYLKNAKMEQLNNYARTVFLTAQNYLTTYTGSGNSLEDGIVDADQVDMAAITPPQTDDPENTDKIYYLKVDKSDPNRQDSPLYALLSNYITDVDIMDKSILIEHNISTAVMRSAFVSDSDTIAWGDVADRTKDTLWDREIGYYGVDYSGFTPAPDDFIDPTLMLVNGDRLLYAQCYVDENYLDYEYVLDIFMADDAASSAGTASFIPSVLDPTATSAVRALALLADGAASYAVYEDTVSDQPGMRKYIIILDSFSAYNAYNDTNAAHNLSISAQFPGVENGFINVTLKATENGEQIGTEAFSEKPRHAYFAENPENESDVSGDTTYIRDARHLNNIRYLSSTTGATFQQIYNTADADGNIVMQTHDGKGITIAPLGAFSGTYDAGNTTPDDYDGDNYKITNLQVSVTPDVSSKKIGLFTSVTANGAVRNVDIQAHVTTGAVDANGVDMGVVAGTNTGKINNVNIISIGSNTSLVSSNGVSQAAINSGGLTGVNLGVVQDCTSDADVIAAGTHFNTISLGGIAGVNDGVSNVTNNSVITIESCNAKGEVRLESSWTQTNSAAGGITGSNYATVKGSLSGVFPENDGESTTNTTNIGYAINNDSVVASKGGSAAAIGGVAGKNFGTLTDNVNIARVENGSTASFAGGIAGIGTKVFSYDRSSITRCYNAGTVHATGSGSSAGGIVGFNGFSSHTTPVTYCYNTGRVNLTTDMVIESSGALRDSAILPLANGFVGGIAGQNGSGSTIQNVYAINHIGFKYNLASVSGTLAGGIIGKDASAADAQVSNSSFVAGNGGVIEPMGETLYPLRDSIHTLYGDSNNPANSAAAVRDALLGYHTGAPWTADGSPYAAARFWYEYSYINDANSQHQTPWERITPTLPKYIIRIDNDELLTVRWTNPREGDDGPVTLQITPLDGSSAAETVTVPSMAAIEANAIADNIFDPAKYLTSDSGVRYPYYFDTTTGEYVLVLDWLDIETGDMENTTTFNRDHATGAVRPAANIQASLTYQNPVEAYESNIEHSMYDSADLHVNTARHIYNIRYNLAGGFTQVANALFANPDDVTMRDFRGNSITIKPAGMLTGTYNGAGMKGITNLNVQSALGDSGMFSQIGPAASVSNITFTNANISGVNGTAAGVVAGTNAGSIVNVTVQSGSISASMNVGGIVGGNAGTVDTAIVKNGVVITETNQNIIPAQPRSMGGVAGLNPGAAQQDIRAYTPITPAANYINSYNGNIQSGTLTYAADGIPTAMTNGATVYITFDDLQLLQLQASSGSDAYRNLPVRIRDASGTKTYPIYNGNTALTLNTLTGGGINAQSMYFIAFTYNAATSRFEYVGTTTELGFIDSPYYGSIKNSVNEASLTGPGGATDGATVYARRLGGIAGTNGGLVERCYSGTITPGLNMTLTQTIHNATQYVPGKAQYIGGVTGLNAGSITTSMNVAQITSDVPGISIGGIAGENTARIEECYNSGTIISTGEIHISNKNGTGCNVGGITGVNADTVLSCYNTGRINALSTSTTPFIEPIELIHSNISGVAGKNGSNTTLKYCYNIGYTGTTRSNGSGSVGGVIGDNTGAGQDVDYLYNLKTNNTVRGLMNPGVIGTGNMSVPNGSLDKDKLQEKQTELNSGGQFSIDVNGSDDNIYKYVYSYLNAAPQACAWEDITIVPAGALGLGTAQSPYLIAEAGDLYVLDMLDGPGVYFSQTADLDMSGFAWSPVEHFEGNYNGNGHKIMNLAAGTSYSGTAAYTGLMASTAPGSTVSSIVFEGVLLEAQATPATTAYAGVVAGVNNGAIEFCEVRSGMVVTTADAASAQYTGGIAGENNGTVLFCSNSAAVAASGGSTASAGGIAGAHNGNIENSYVAGVVSLQNAGEGSGVGSIAGSGGGAITGCVYISGMGMAQVQAAEATMDQLSGANLDTAVLHILNNSVHGPAWVFDWESGFPFPVINRATAIPVPQVEVGTPAPGTPAPVDPVPAEPVPADPAPVETPVPTETPVPAETPTPEATQAPTEEQPTPTPQQTPDALLPGNDDQDIGPEIDDGGGEP